MRNDRPGSRWLIVADGMAVLVLIITGLLSVQAVCSRPRAMAPTLVRPGIIYEGIADAGGFIHLITVDLRSPNIAVELGPPVSSLNEHRLFWLPNLVQQEGLAVAMSGGDFTTSWGRYAAAGERGQPTRALIVNGRTLQRQSTGVLLWFDEFQTGHMDAAAADSPAWTSARWCVGSHHGLIHEGRIESKEFAATTSRLRRTCVALDRTGCTLLFATFESATESDAAQFLASRGVWKAMELATAENAGLVVNNQLTAGWPSRPQGPQRFITHALAVRTSESTAGSTGALSISAGSRPAN